MRKAEIPKASNGELIVDYILTYSSYCLNVNTGRGEKQLCNHLKDLDSEFLKRNILTQSQIDRLY